MPKLYEIASQVEELLARIPETGEVPPEFETELEALNLSLVDKVENCVKYLRRLQADEAAYSTEMARLATAKASVVRQIEHFKEYVQRELVRAGVTKVDAGTFKVSVCQNSRPSIVLASDTIPKEYRVVAESFNAQLAYEHWKSGEGLPPEIEVRQDTHLRVR